MPEKKNLFVLSGPSGSGKNTVYNGLTELIPELTHTVSATTRAPRAGEIHSVDYYFISENDFSLRLQQGDFIEHVNYGGNLYGTLKSEIDRLTSMNKILVLIIEVNGAIRFKELFPESETIFIIPPSLEELKRRISGRGQNSEEELQTRLQIAAAEMEMKDKYDHVVVNDVLEDCINEVYHIIKGE